MEQMSYNNDSDNRMQNEANAQSITQRYLTFCSDNLYYALNTNIVTEIITNATITFLPQLPNFVSGIINLRGAIVPIIDIRARLGKPTITPPEHSCIIVLDVDTIAIGIIVDEVCQVIDIEQAKISGIPAKNHQELVIGMTSRPDGTNILFLDCNLLVNSEK